MKGLHSLTRAVRKSSLEAATQPTDAPVAQLDRASDYESEGRTFESFRARHKIPEFHDVLSLPFGNGPYFGHAPKME